MLGMDKVLLGRGGWRQRQPSRRTRPSWWRDAARGVAALGLAASVALPAAAPPAFANHLDAYGATLDEIAENPAAFYGRTVTVDGEVGDMLGPRSFTLEDSDLLFDEEIPVVASQPLVDTAGRPIDPEVLDDRFVQVVGTVHQFNALAFEDRLGIDLDDTAWEAWRGGPAIIATHVMLPVALPPVVAPAAALPSDWVTVDDITDNPAAYQGQIVRVNGEVEEVTGAVTTPGVGPWAFAIEDSDFLFDEQALVIGAGPQARAAGPGVAPMANPFADLDGRFVWVTGEVRTFNIAEFERELGVDLDDAVFGGWEGQVAIIARSVRIAPAYPDPYAP
jgi:hypothetical protein